MRAVLVVLALSPGSWGEAHAEPEAAGVAQDEPSREAHAAMDFFVADLHAAYRGFSDRSQLSGIRGAGLFGLGARGGTADPLGWLLALDADVGFGLRDGIAYDLGLRGGPAWAVSEHVLLAVTTGPGAFAITEGRVPLALELPVELVAVWGFKPETGYQSPPTVLLEAHLRQSWVFGAAARDGGSSLPWLDELRAGLRLGVQATRRDKGELFPLAIVTQSTYHELMGTKGVLITAGVGTVGYHGWAP